MLYDTFRDALAAFRRWGGAMSFHPASSKEPDRWEVDDAEELAERITCTAREATENALAAGGLTPAEIAAEMAEWQEPR